MKVLIKVTKDILIKTADCNDMDGFNCAVAEAVREILPTAWVSNSYIKVFTEELYNKNRKCNFTIVKDKGKYISMPENAKQFTKDFDKLKSKDRVKMTPFSFEIDVPNELIDDIGIKQVYKILSESKSLELTSI